MDIWKRIDIPKIPESGNGIPMRINFNETEDFVEGIEEEKIIQKKKKEENEKEKAEFVILICGDPGVGKSTLMKRIINNEFLFNTRITIGVENSNVMFTYQGLEIKCLLFDCAGESLNQTAFTTHFKKADVVVLCYESDNASSLDNARRKWYPYIISSSSKKTTFGLYLVGCKSDKKLGVLLDEEVLDVAEEIQAESWFTSSKNDIGVKDLFQNIGFFLVERKLGYYTDYKRKVSENSKGFGSEESNSNPVENPAHDENEEYFFTSFFKGFFSFFSCRFMCKDL